MEIEDYEDQFLEADECLEYDPKHPENCNGRVEYHWPGHGFVSFPRCAKHAEERLDKEEQHRQDYPDSPNPPSWFDPDYAGERWDDDY